MKILHVLYSGLGGHGNVFFSMVAADENDEFEYEALFNGVEEVKAEYIKKCDALNIKWKYVKKKPGFNFSYYKSMAGIIKKSNAGIIFLHSSAYILPAKLANVFNRKKKKIIIRETQSNQLKTKIEKLWLSMTFLWADKIVFLTEEYKNEIEKKPHWLYREKKVVVIPNGIDLTIFHPGSKINKDWLNIGMQSRLTENKDHTTLLRAFSLLKKQGYNNIKLKIAGDGKCKAELILLSQQLKIDSEVEFTGMLEENALIKFLQDVNIYIHASFGETMSTAIIQAMACGLPIIASDVPGIKNMIINNTTGIIVPVKNEQLMADAIKHLLNNSSFADELGDNAYIFAKQNYSNLIMFKKYKELFTS